MTGRGRGGWIALAIGIWLTLSGHAGATVVVPADLGELAHDAFAIARGRVVAVDGRWADGRRAIETLVTLQVEGTLKGAPGPTVQFRVPGGTFGRYTNIVVGAPRFDVGQQVIVFLGARGPSVPFVLGLNQGVFRVLSGDNGEALVMPPPVLPATTGPMVRGSRTRTPSSLADFEREVRALVGGGR